MREIKFRAWNHDEEVMMSQMLLSWDGNRFYSEVDNELTVMQYTGLKDKDGTPIYEGDILANPTDATIRVDWNDEWAQFVAIDVNDKQDYGLFANTLDDGRKTYEVIGNIYQNPELLS